MKYLTYLRKRYWPIAIGTFIKGFGEESEYKYLFIHVAYGPKHPAMNNDWHYWRQGFGVAIPWQLPWVYKSYWNEGNPKSRPEFRYPPPWAQQ